MTQTICLTPLTEGFAEALAYPECHQIILHLHNADAWPLLGDMAQFVAGLEGEPRRWAEFILANAQDDGFPMRAEALETATLKIEAKWGDANKSAFAIEHD